MRQSIRSTGSSTGTASRCYVHVVLLNKEELTVYVEPKAKVQEVFNQVCHNLGLRESDYFGLAQLVDGEFHFLQHDVKLHKVAPRGWKSLANSSKEVKPGFTLYFRVQYYVDHVMLLRERVTRQQYYQQLRENLLNYSQLCSEEKCFLLAAYALQADQGNFHDTRHKGQYFDPREYFPAWVITKHGREFILHNMPTMHRDLRGMTKMEAQMHFIKDVSAPPTAHNLHFYRLKKRKNETPGSAWLGICAKGIEIYEDLNEFKNMLSTFLWPDIGKLYFEKKKFEIRAVGTPEGRKFTYYTGSDDRSKYLLALCRGTHLFQMTVQPKLAEIQHLDAEDKRRYKEAYIDWDSNDVAWEQEQSSVHSMQSLSTQDSVKKHNRPPQRISVISNTSSNTTSGIVSDKMCLGLDDSDADDRSVEIMIDSPPKLAGSFKGLIVKPIITQTTTSTPKDDHIPSSKAVSKATEKSSDTKQSVSRTGSVQSQQSGKLALTPAVMQRTIPQLPKPAPSKTVSMTLMAPGTFAIASSVPVSNHPAPTPHPSGMAQPVAQTPRTSIPLTSHPPCTGHPSMAGQPALVSVNSKVVSSGPTLLSVTQQPQQVTAAQGIIYNQLRRSGERHIQSPALSAQAMPVSHMQPQRHGNIPSAMIAQSSPVLQTLPMGSAHLGTQYGDIYTDMDSRIINPEITTATLSNIAHPVTMLPTEVVSSHPVACYQVSPQVVSMTPPQQYLVNDVQPFLSENFVGINENFEGYMGLNENYAGRVLPSTSTPVNIRAMPPPPPQFASPVEQHRVVPPPPQAPTMCMDPSMVVLSQPAVPSACMDQARILPPPPTMGMDQSIVAPPPSSTMYVEHPRGPLLPAAVMNGHPPNKEQRRSRSASSGSTAANSTSRSSSHSSSKNSTPSQQHKNISPQAGNDAVSLSVNNPTEAHSRRSWVDQPSDIKPEVAAELRDLKQNINVKIKKEQLPMLTALCNDSSLLPLTTAPSCNCCSDLPSSGSAENKRFSYDLPRNADLNDPGTMTRPMSWHSETFNLDRQLQAYNMSSASSGNGDHLFPPSAEAVKAWQNPYGSQQQQPLFPARITSGGHSPNSSDTLTQEAGMGLA